MCECLCACLCVSVCVYVCVSVCLPIAWETGVQSQVESYQRLKKWSLMLPCLILSIIRQGSRVKWSNPGKGVAPSPTPLLKRKPLGHSRLMSPTLLFYSYFFDHIYISIFYITTRSCKNLFHSKQFKCY